MNAHKLMKRTRLVSLMAIILGIPFPLMATDFNQSSGGEAFVASQSNKISGTIKDSQGEPIIGASIIEVGTTNGTITDYDGKFTLTTSGKDLRISYIGYITQTIKTHGAGKYDIVLKEDNKTLDEVVVVGYGTQKKVNLSGSVSSVDVGKLTESRPIVNVSQALAGMAAGVQVTSGNNRPGDDNASILVRGQGTLNNSSPLIIIDGVEAGINTVNPQDIASMSILKDAASASIYGSRAANGVILITTKKGEAGSLKIDYNGYVSFESIRKTLTPVSNYANYMGLVNEGLSNSGLSTVFSQTSIDAWRNDAGKNPTLYPNTDWIDETFKNSTSTNHIISLSGGSDKIKVYGSFGYMDNPGVMENTGTTKYNGRFNMEANVKPWLTVGMQLSGYVSNSDPANTDNVFTYASATTPGMVFRAPDGRYGAMNNLEDDAQAANNNPLWRLNSTTGNTRNDNVRARFTGTFKPFKNFSINASYSYEGLNQLKETKPVFIDLWDFQTESVTKSGVTKSSVYNYNYKLERDFWDITANYENRFFQKNLGLKAMVGASSEQYWTKNFSATKYDMIDTSLDVIDAATGDASASGNKTDWAMNSYFGRINLDWNNKYLLEFNLRTDGSSRFAKGNRWGWFPSFSAAWRLDQENFMKNLVDKGLSNLKLRASYGTLGNNAVANYAAISVYGQSNYVLNNSLATGLAQLALANHNLSWESTYVADAGIDFGFLNGKLTGTIDYFNKKTKNILINLPAPDVHGTATIPTQNSAQVTNKGLEFSMGWNDKIGDFSYSVSGNFTYVTNNVDKYKGKGVDGRTISGSTLIWEGHPINAHYLLIADRIIQTDKDLELVQKMIDNAPVDATTGKQVNPFSAYGTPKKGDYLYRDANGDGIINSDDRVVCSDGTNPKFYYGLNLSVAWKGIDFSALIQGVGDVKEYSNVAAYNTPTVRYGYQINKEIVDGRWYEGRTDATYPRLLSYTDTRNTQASTAYLQSKAYMKIRNIQLGYTIPKSITNMMQIDRLRVYGSLENFFTFTSYKGFDPEVSGLDYPTTKQAVVGINVTF